MRDLQASLEVVNNELRLRLYQAARDNNGAEAARLGIMIHELVTEFSPETQKSPPATQG